jgi:hypothetical protein
VDGHGRRLGETRGKAVLDSCHSRCPGQRLGPLPDGMGWRHNIGDLEAHTMSGQPVLEGAEETQRRLSSCMGSRISGYDETPYGTTPSQGEE